MFFTSPFASGWVSWKRNVLRSLFGGLLYPLPKPLSKLSVLDVKALLDYMYCDLRLLSYKVIHLTIRWIRFWYVAKKGNDVMLPK